MSERVVVTGLGAITALGNDVPTYWAGLVAGRSGVAAISSYDTAGQAVRIAAEIKDLDVIGLLGSGLGFLATVLLYALAGLAYGGALTRLTRGGYMPPPEDLDIEL